MSTAMACACTGRCKVWPFTCSGVPDMSGTGAFTVYPIAPQVQGCICPPTSEKTCESPTCPRKPFRWSEERTSAQKGEACE